MNELNVGKLAENTVDTQSFLIFTLMIWSGRIKLNMVFMVLNF